MKKTILLLVFGLWQVAALAQETTSSNPEFETDRADRTDASSLVPRGYFQLETGFQFLKSKQEGLENRQWLYPQALFRTGILKAAELRLEATYRTEEYRAGKALLQQDKGLSTVRVGTKVKAIGSQGARPEVSVLAMLELPLAKDAFEPSKVAPEIKLLFTNNLTDKWRLQYNAGFRREPEEGEMENKVLFSASLGGKLSEKLTLFAEFAGEKPKGSSTENVVDTGFQYLLLPNLQLDAIVGKGVSSQAPDLFMGGGLSVRLPK
ncbi:transporter [Rufibacter soli]